MILGNTERGWIKRHIAPVHRKLPPDKPWAYRQYWQEPLGFNPFWLVSGIDDVLRYQYAVWG